MENEWYSGEFGGNVSVFHRWHRFTASGNLGTPSAASAQRGQTLLAALTDQTVKFLTDFASWPPMPVIGPKPS